MDKKYLIVGPSWVGDMVMAQSLFRLIKNREPHSLIDVLAPKHCQAILEAMPEVSNAINLPFTHGQFLFSKRKAFGRTLTKDSYTDSIILPNSWKSALIPYFAKIPTRTGFKGESRYLLLNDCRKLNKNALPMMIQRFCTLGVPAGEPLSPSLPKPRLVLPQTWMSDTKSTFNLALEKPVLTLCPGAEFGPAKQWPARHYAEVAKYYLQLGWDVWLLGAKGDQACTSEIASLASGVSDYAGLTSLEQAMALIALSSRLVTNDSGLMHIAAALNIPLVAVYGSTSPLFTPPLSDNSSTIGIDLACRPCFKRQCPKKGDLHLKCLNDLEPSSVIRALDAM